MSQALYFADKQQLVVYNSERKNNMIYGALLDSADSWWVREREDGAWLDANPSRVTPKTWKKYLGPVHLRAWQRSGQKKANERWFYWPATSAAFSANVNHVAHGSE